MIVQRIRVYHQMMTPRTKAHEIKWRLKNAENFKRGRTKVTDAFINRNFGVIIITHL